ncbi:MAG: hypothetical protein QXZ44_03535 [Ferroplasma sp.]
MNDLSNMDQIITQMASYIDELQKRGNSKRVQVFWNIAIYGRMVTFIFRRQ